MYISTQESFGIVEAHGLYVQAGKILDLPKDEDGYYYTIFTNRDVMLGRYSCVEHIEYVMEQLFHKLESTSYCTYEMPSDLFVKLNIESRNHDVLLTNLIEDVRKELRTTFITYDVDFAISELEKALNKNPLVVTGRMEALLKDLHELKIAMDLNEQKMRFALKEQSNIKRKNLTRRHKGGLTD